MKSSVKMSDVVKGITINLKISGCREASLRIKAASLLINLASKVGGFSAVNVELSTEVKSAGVIPQIQWDR